MRLDLTTTTPTNHPGWKGLLFQNAAPGWVLHTVCVTNFAAILVLKIRAKFAILVALMDALSRFIDIKLEYMVGKLDGRTI